MLAIVAPGQGAQTPGFLTPWLALPQLAHRLDWFSAVAGRDLAWLGTAGNEDEIRDTAVCQPLLVAIGLAVTAELGTDGVAVVAGHSIGEITAAAIARALTPEAALVIARERGEAMAAASAAAPTGMSAVLGGDADIVSAAIADLGLVLANDNGAGQVVAAGSLTALDQLPARLDGVARVIALKVAGAFHTPYMDDAHKRLQTLSAAIPVSDPQIPVLSNADGAYVTSGDELLRRLVAQVAAPVRWADCMQTLLDAGVTAVIELPPAGTLTGLAKRAMKGVETLALKSPDDLDAARRLLSDHRTRGDAAAPSWRLVVAPTSGTFSAPSREETLAPGALLGRVQGRRDVHDVVAAHGGTVVEWLVRDGDPVKPGQPIVRLHPLGDSA